MSFWRLSPSSLSGTLGDKWETKSQLSILHGRFCKVFLTFYVFISYVLNPDYRSNAVLSTGYGSNTTRRGSWHLRAKVLVKRTKNQQTRELTGELQIMTSWAGTSFTTSILFTNQAELRVIYILVKIMHFYALCSDRYFPFKCHWTWGNLFFYYFI